VEILYILLILLVITRTFGELAIRCGQPPLVGELIGGVLLGIVVRHFPDTFPVLSELSDNDVFTAITDLGIFFLMLLGGMEMRPEKIAESSRKAFLVAVSGMVVPFSLGTAVAWHFLPDSDYTLAQSVFVGTALAITAVPVAIRILMDLKKLDSPFGQVIVSAAIFDDILSLILLAFLTALIKTGEPPDMKTLSLLLGKAALFFVSVFLAGRYLIQWLGDFIKRFRLDELEMSFLLVTALCFALLAEFLSMHFILGAFAAGLFFQKHTIDARTHKDVTAKVSGITMGFFAPVFFASIGLHLDLSALTAVPFFLAVVILTAFVSKLAGAAVPAFFMGFSTRESLAVGTAMSARGAVELIIADIALRAGLFLHPVPQPPVVEHIFSVIVMVAIVTTVSVPVVLRFIMRTENSTTS